MPYNTTAIPPRREPTGQAQLPLSRVKKIIALDQDIALCSNNAAFVITVATEMFIQYMAEQAHVVVKSERKPRRNIQYRDLSTAVSHIDNLEFLVDIVPRTVPFKAVKEKTNKTTSTATSSNNLPNNSSLPRQNGEGSSNPNSMMEIGQTTLNMNGGAGRTGARKGIGMNGNGFGYDGAVDEDDEEDGEGRAVEVNGEGVEGEDPNAQLQAESERLEDPVDDEGEDVEMS